MPPRPLTLADLRKAGTITSLEIVAAIDAYMLDPAAGLYCFASGYTLDVASSVLAALGDVGATERSSPQAKAFRNRVAVAVMAACPSPP